METGMKVDRDPVIRSEMLANMSVNGNWSSNDVWVPGDDEAFMPAKVLEKKGNRLVVQLRNNKTIELNAVDAARMNPPEMDGIEDMANLTHLNEPSLLHNLEYRYKNGRIYTYSGLFLIAVNPYRDLPIYGDVQIEAYRMGNPKHFQPHIFAVAESSYRAMIEDGINQSILITGESGAGKTENTKKVIQYITAVACKRNKPNTKADAREKNSEFLHALENSIMVSNTILEAFGNAKTVKNDNSSRFGKSICIEFDHNHMICGSSIKWYLLEKSRVTHTNPEERNYHVFYQFMKGADRKLKEKYFITGDLSDYKILKNTVKSIPGVDDALEFSRLLESMKMMGFKDEESDNFIRLICAILHLGQIEFVETPNGVTAFDSPQSGKSCELACKVLGVPVKKFTEALLQPSITAGKEVVVQSVSPAQARYSVDSIARATYECLFAALVDLINKYMAPKVIPKSYILVLDISGFEILEKNRFEQLCINLSNEKLQQFFNHHMFIKEQEEYIKEGIEWNYIDFKQDLQPTINLIEGKDGVFRCLDTLCFLQNSTDEKFLSELTNRCSKKHDMFIPSRFGTGFSIKHYAGVVEYSGDGWIEKNRDPVNIAALKCLSNSSIKRVSDIYSDYGSTKIQMLALEDPRIPSLVKKGQFHTNSQIHREQLNTLMGILYTTQSCFVRCILPNRDKQPNFYCSKLVMEQLKCNGVYEGLRSLRSGFPNRVQFDIFARRYGILLEGFTKSELSDPRTISVKILNFLKINEDLYRVGNSKVLLRAGLIAEIEEKKNIAVSNKVIRIQAFIRGWLARKKYKNILQLEESATILQNNIKAFLRLHSDPWWRLYVRLRPFLNIMEEEEDNNEFMKEIGILEASLNKEIAEKQKTASMLHESVNREKQTLEHLNAANAELATKRETIAGLSEKVSALEEKVAALEYVQSENELNITKNAALNEKLITTTKDYEEASSSLLAAVAKVASLEESQNKFREQLNQSISANNRLTAELASERSALDKSTLELSKYENIENLLKIEKNKLMEDNQLINEEKARLNAKITVLSQEISDLKQDKHKAEDENAENKKDISRLSEKLSALEEENKNLSLNLKNTCDSLANAKKELSSLTDDNKHLNEKIKSLNDHIELRCTAESRQSDLVRMREAEIAELKDKIIALKDEYNVFKKKSEENYQILETKNDEMRRSVNHYKDALSLLQDKYDRKENLVKSVSGEKANLQVEVNNLKKNIESISVELTTVKSNEKLLDDKTKELSKLLKEKTTEACNAVCAQKRLSDKCGLLESEMHKSDSKIISLESELNSSRSRINALTSQLEEKVALTKQFELDIQSLKEVYNSDVSMKVSEIEKANESLKCELKQLKNLSNLLSKENESMKIENSDLTKQNERLVGENEDLKVYVNKDQQAIDTLSQKLMNSDAKLESVLKERDNETYKYINLAKELDAVKRDLSEATATVEQQNALIMSHQDERKEYTDKLDSIINQLTDNDKNINNLEETNMQMSKELDKCRETISYQEDALKKVNEEINSIKDDYEAKLQKEKLRYSNIEENYTALEDAYEREVGDFEKHCNELEREVQKLKLLNEHMTQRVNEYEKSKPDLGGDTEYYVNIRQTYENRLTELTDKITETNKKEIEGRERIRKLESTVKDLKSELDFASLGYESSEEECAKLKQELKTMRDRVSQLTSEIKVANDSKDRFSNKVKMLNEKLQNAEKKLGEYDSAAANAQVELTVGEIEELKERIGQLRSAETALLLKIKNMHGIIHDKDISYKLLDDKCNQLSKKLATANSELEKESAQVVELKSNIDNIVAERIKLQDEIKNANSCISGNQKIIESLNNKIKKLTDRATDAESSLKLSRADSSLKMRTASLEISNDNLNRLLQSKEAQISNLEKKLEFMAACEVSGLNKINELSQEKINLTAQIESVVTEYEGKISELTSNITELEMDAKREKEKLKNMLLLEKSFTEDHRNQSSKYIAECHSIKGMLSEAQRECEDLTAKNTSLMDLNKKLTNKCKECEAAVRNINEYLKKVCDANSTLRFESLGQEKTIQELKNKETTLLSQRDDAMSELSRVKLGNDTLKEENEILKRERDRITDEVELLKQRLCRQNEELSSKEQQLSAFNNNIQELSSQLNDVNAQKNAYRREITRLNIDIEAITNTNDEPIKNLVESLSNTICEKTSMIDNLKDNIFKLENEIRTQKQSIIEIKGKLELEHKASVEIKRDREALENKVKSLKAEIESLKDQLSSKDLQIRDALSKLEDMQERSNIISVGGSF